MCVCVCVCGCVCVWVCLHDDTAAGCWVIVGADLILIAEDVVDVRVALPLIIHLGDGDQLDSLPLRGRDMVMLKKCFLHFGKYAIAQCQVDLLAAGSWSSGRTCFGAP